MDDRWDGTIVTHTHGVPRVDGAWNIIAHPPWSVSRAVSGSLCFAIYSHSVRHGPSPLMSPHRSPVGYGPARGGRGAPLSRECPLHDASPLPCDDAQRAHDVQRLSYDGLRLVLTWIPPVNGEWFLTLYRNVLVRGGHNCSLWNIDFASAGSRANEQTM